MRRAGAAVRVLLLLVVAAIAGIGWYDSSQILGPDAPPPIDEVAVLAADDTSVTVTPDATGDVLANGVSTLEWPGGWGEMSDRLARAGAAVPLRGGPAHARRSRVRSGVDRRSGRRLPGVEHSRGR